MSHLIVPFVIPAIGAAMVVTWAAASDPADAVGQQEAPRCFLSRQVNGFNARGRDAVDVHVGANRYYRLTLGGPCPDVDWSLRAGIRTLGGGSWICQGADAEIIVPSPNGRQRCLVTDVRALTPDEVAASRRHR